MAEQLPEGWITTSLSEIASKLVDGSHNPPAKQATGLPMLSAVNINDNKILFSDFRWITEAGFKQEDQRTKITPGDVLLTIVGAIGRTAVVPEGIQQFTLQRSVAVITPVLVSSKFLMYQIESPRVARYFTDNARGTAQKGVYLKTLGATEIWLPPLAEQHRIVAKIEELFSELDQGVSSLKTAREQLKVYRQSLLKNAFAGKLTAAWRAAHRDQLETAAALQQRIARERQARYQQQLADWQAAGQAGPKPKPPKPLSPLTAEELAEVPELPKGWGWVSVSQLLAEELCNGKSVKDRKGGFPVLRLNALGDGKIDLSIQKEGAWTATEAKNYVVEVGDFLVSRGNGSKHLVGRGGFVSALNGMLVAFPDTMIRIRLLRQLVDFRYFGLCWDSILVRRQIENTARTTAGIYKINQELIEAYKIPLPTAIEEQQLIVQELESKLSEADQLDQTLATALQQADALRQSILKKAFSGQLVKQDKNDEPATALLERIRAAKSAPCQGKRRRIAPEQPAILELTASPGQVIPFPVPLPGIAAKDLQAGILAMAYRLHEPDPEKLQHFGHVKAEKICHLVEAHLGLDLERQPLKEAAGPNDYPQLKRVEHRARMANWFDVTRLDSGKYVFHPKPGFSRLLDKTRLVLGARLGEVERLLELMLPMTMRQAEILATVYAAWNNLLLLGKSPNDEEIVTEARENWHESKLKIERGKFFTALAWKRGKGLVPSGMGRFVKAKGEV